MTFTRVPVLMTVAHPRWAEFIATLQGPEYCNFRLTIPDDPKSFAFDCLGGKDKTKATSLLRVMGFTQEAVEASLAYFEAHGGFCDCEIIFNVMDSVSFRLGGHR